ncbi:MAG TPA: amidohydrolase family protein [Candidatus Bathyarchaeia archaeon]|nr:amidohydrolase family protein [Candidatus Bathyarchaeia archaeon]
MDFDLAIRGGTLFDGTGSPGVRGDVGIRGGRIVALGEATGAAAQTIDAGGLAVAPGFIDIHTHYDAQVMWDRMLTISPWHGVTTVVMGNCGFGVAPTRPDHRGLIMRTLEKVEGMSLAALEAGLGKAWPFETFPEYLDAVEQRGTALNVAVLLGHTPLRLYVMGEEATERPATADELARMRALVREAIDAGAIGFATSKASTHIGYAGKPVPSRAAQFAEIETLAGALAEAGRGIIQATVGRELFFKEFEALARATGRPVTWTALLAGMMGPGSHRDLLEKSRVLWRQGLKVVPQVACRTLNFEFQFSEPFLFEGMSVFRPISTADVAGKMRLYADPEFRRAFKESFDRPRPGAVFAGGSWARTWISWYPVEPALEERTVTEVAAERGVHPIDLALDLALATKLEARFRMAVFNHDEDEVAELLAEPGAVLGLSDAGAHASQLCDACFSTYLLSRWVREKQAIAMPEAIRMLTSRPAEVFGITDRGRLALGLAADAVVFDPATVGASKLRRVHDLPTGADRLVADATGIEAVVVNGVVIRRGGRDAVAADGPLPGALLRSGTARPMSAARS